MIFILKGDIETGKSSTLLKWTQGRKDCRGILSPGNAPGERYFLNVSTGKEFRMEADPWEEDVIEVGRFRFLASAFDKANTILSKAAKLSEGIIIIDELGKLELRDEGLHKSAELVLERERSNADLIVILVVRTSLVEDIITKYEISDYKIIFTESVDDLTAYCNNSYTENL